MVLIYADMHSVMNVEKIIIKYLYIFVCFIIPVLLKNQGCHLFYKNKHAI